MNPISLEGYRLTPAELRQLQRFLLSVLLFFAAFTLLCWFVFLHSPAYDTGASDDGPSISHAASGEYCRFQPAACLVPEEEKA